MNLLDDNLPAEAVDDVEGSGESGEEDKNFLNDLEEMAKEVEDDPKSID